MSRSRVNAYYDIIIIILYSYYHRILIIIYTVVACVMGQPDLFVTACRLWGKAYLP